MPKPDPTEFCCMYLAALAKSGSWEAFKSSPIWTQRATEAAEQTCLHYGLSINREYLRLDVAGWERIDANRRDDWILRVAFEHENALGKWPDEFCKLAHVVADLKVLAFYHRFDQDGPVEAMIEERAGLLHDRIARVADSRWIFIVGPCSQTPRQKFVVFTLNEGRVMQLTDVHSFCPCDLSGFHDSAQHPAILPTMPH